MTTSPFRTERTEHRSIYELDKTDVRIKVWDAHGNYVTAERAHLPGGSVTRDIAWGAFGAVPPDVARTYAAAIAYAAELIEREP